MSVITPPPWPPRSDRQRGMALILAIAMLMILSILGATVLDVVSRDVRATGQVDVQDQSFRTVDRAVSFGQFIAADISSDPTIDLLDRLKTRTNIWPIVDPTGRDTFGNMESGTLTFVGMSDTDNANMIADIYRIDAIINDNAPNNPTRIGVNMAFMTNERRDAESGSTKRISDNTMRSAALSAAAGK